MLLLNACAVAHHWMQPINIIYIYIFIIIAYQTQSMWLQGIKIIHMKLYSNTFNHVISGFIGCLTTPLPESPQLQRTGGGALRDVTPPLPPKGLHLHFLWVLAECLCAVELFNIFQIKQSRADTPQPQDGIRRRTDAPWSTSSFEILNKFSWRSRVGVDFEVGGCVCVCVWSVCVFFFFLVRLY